MLQKEKTTTATNRKNAERSQQRTRKNENVGENDNDNGERARRRDTIRCTHDTLQAAREAEKNPERVSKEYYSEIGVYK